MHTGTFIDGLIRIIDRVRMRYELSTCEAGRSLTGDMRDAVRCGASATVADLEGYAFCKKCFFDENPEVARIERSYRNERT